MKNGETPNDEVKFSTLNKRTERGHSPFFFSVFVFVLCCFMTDRQLIDAVEAGDYEKAHHLLSSLRINIDSSPRGKEGWIPLCLAVQIGNLELVKLLIEKGANLDLSNEVLSSFLAIFSKILFPETH